MNTIRASILGISLATAVVASLPRTSTRFEAYLDIATQHSIANYGVSAQAIEESAYRNHVRTKISQLLDGTHPTLDHTASWCRFCKELDAYAQREGIDVTNKLVVETDRHQRITMQEYAMRDLHPPEGLPLLAVREKFYLGFDPTTHTMMDQAGMEKGLKEIVKEGNQPQ